MSSRRRAGTGETAKSVLTVGVVDFFSGCGGASAGFSQARVQGTEITIIAGVDNDPHSCATYERALGHRAHNIDIASLVAGSASKLDGLVESWQLQRFDKVIFIGCAPCQGFAAHRKSVRGRDHRRSLFGIFAEIVARIGPDAVFMENVPDIFSKKHWPHFKAGRDVLEAAGYITRSQVFNFATFGLPQERFRAVMMAFKQPFAMPEPLLDHGDFVTVHDAISHLPPLWAGECDPRDPMHVVSKHRQSTIEVLKKVPRDGGNRPVGVGPSCLDRARDTHGGYTDVYGRLSWRKPAVTITARCRTPSCGRFAHPEQHRGLSVREAALLQGFPPQFVFEGPFDDKYKQIGNAVPPLIAKVMAEHMLNTLLLHAKGEAIVTSAANDVRAPVGPGFAVTINGIKRRRSSNSPQVLKAAYG